MSSDSRQNNPSRPSGFDERYRLYLDESGDHVFRETMEIPHRFLCLLGCWFKNTDYINFHKALDELKSRHFGHHPDEPVILHREDMINRRRAFKVLQNEEPRQRFDADLIETIKGASFTVVAVVIDKNTLRSEFGSGSAHPYHLAMGFMLQRFAGYMNHINRVGDVMAESRGGVEDRLLAESYTRIFERGTWNTDTIFFHNALSSRQLKLKQKSANISGLQLSDLLGHPLKQYVLKQYGFISDDEIGEFAHRLQPVYEKKFNYHLYDGRIEGYGYVLYPKK